MSAGRPKRVLHGRTRGGLPFARELETERTWERIAARYLPVYGGEA